MKKSLKGQQLVYQVAEGQYSIIGTRHWIVRVQYVGQQLKKDLAQVGLFGFGATKNGEAISEPDISKIFPRGMDGYAPLIKTSYQDSGKRVFLTTSGNNILADNTYVEDIENLFRVSKKDKEHTWFSKGDLSPLVYGDRLGLVLPYRVTSTTHKVVRV